MDFLEIVELKKIKKLKKKLKYGLMGCGCLLVCITLLGIVATGALTGVFGYVAGLARSLGIGLPVISLPTGISLPQEIRLPPINLPKLPANPLKLSPQEQVLLGREVAAKQGLDQKAFSDPRINKIAVRLIKALPKEYHGPGDLGGWEWKFRGLRTENGAVNAIALPGGKIYIYDGLLKLIGSNDDQLAAVLAHEMAHVVEEHSAEQLLASGLLQTAAELLIQSSGEGSYQEDMIRILAAQMGKQVTEMRLSQSAEYQADDIGFRMMAVAGYDPVAGLQILKELGKISGSKDTLLSGVFSTHPPADKRVRKLQEKIDSYKMPGS